MATSGWQNEQTWFTYSSHIHLIGNIRIDSINHSGSNLRIRGAIAGGARGDNNYRFYYLDYTSYAQPEGGGKMALGGKGKTWRVGDGDEYADFDVTLTGVSPSTTSRSFFVNFYGPNTNSVVATLRWNLWFDASGSAPSGGSITNIVPKWDRITATIGGVYWGGLNPEIIQLKILKSVYVANVPARQNHYANNAGPITTTVTNQSNTLMNPTWVIHGCDFYYTGLYAQNSMGVLRYQGPTTYTPPAPGVLQATDPGGAGSKTYPCTYTGVVSNNATDYDQTKLNRTIRYKINDGEWVYVKNASVETLDTVTSFNVTVPADSDATIEAWMTYQNLQSEVSTTTLRNGNAPFHTYGSVDGKSKDIIKFYGSVNGQSKEIVKLYGSVDGKSKQIYG